MTAVIWIGNPRSAREAIPCPTCGAEIGASCYGGVFPLPHLSRDERAFAFGFRDVRQPGPLFEGARDE